MYQSKKEKLNAIKAKSATAFRNGCIAASGLMVASGANAAIDVTGVNTAIGNAETSAHTVGTTVIGVIAGLAVVGVVIGLVRKL